MVQMNEYGAGFDAAHPVSGLCKAEVEQRMERGECNCMRDSVTPSVGKIILKNTLTPFNIINFCLMLAIVAVGHPRNALFFLIAVSNTLMGIIQELRAKHTLDKLSILARGKVAVVRDGRLAGVQQDDVVMDDVLVLESGRQICADAVVLHTEALEVDESLLTGEADPIPKKPGDTVLSGSFAVAGMAYARVCAVGQNSYAGKLSVQAKQEKKHNPPLQKTLNTIIRVLAIAIVPVGLLLFYNQYTGSGDLEASVLGAAAAMVGMIPEGLVLLTGVTLTLGAMKLASRKALVQSLPSIETLARADVLCLDKTGTITDGTLTFEAFCPAEGFTSEAMAQAVTEMMAALQDDNATARALRAAFPGDGGWLARKCVPFSSARKWSAACFSAKGSFVLGAPTFVLPGMNEGTKRQIQQLAAQGFRVLCLARSAAALPETGLPVNLRLMGLVVLGDSIRAEAPDTFRFFEDEGVALKVISGDDALTVSSIAQKAGIANAGQYIDLSGAPQNVDYGFLVQKYTVFGRASPEQKRQLVAALKAQGHTVCMTGDGVNDVPAMKEADCGVAMISGSEAARGAADFVLMTSNFAAMVDVLKEGRRVINNIENVASMYLVKTIYSTILSFLYVFIPYPYPFTTLQISPISSFTVGIPSFLLSLRPDYDRPKGRFGKNVLENAMPAALSVVFNILVIQLAGVCFDLPFEQTSTMNVLLTGMVGFRLLIRVSRPMRKQDIALVSVLGAAFIGTFFILGDFFMLDNILNRNAFFYVPLLYFGSKLFDKLAVFVDWLERKFAHDKELTPA